MPPKNKKRTAEDSAANVVQKKLAVANDLCVNANLHKAMALLDKQALGCPTFNGVLEMAPTNKSGVPAYDAKECQKHFSEGLDYHASIPLHWINHVWELQPNIPRHDVNVPLKANGMRTSYG